MEEDNKFITTQLAATINDLLEKGLTVDEIAEHLDVSVAVVSAQSTIYEPPKTKRAMLEHQLTSLVPLLEIAKLQYRKDPRQGSSTALTQIANQMQSLIKQLEEIETPEELYNGILKILQNLVKNMIASLTREARDFQKGLENAGVSEAVIKHQIDNLLRGFSIPAKNAYDEAARKVADLLEYEDDGEEGESSPPGVIPLPSRR